MKVAQLCLTLCDLMDYTVHGILQARILEWVASSLLQEICQPRDQTQISPHCGQILLPAEPPGKPKNTGVGSLSLLQRIFLTQESNQGFLHGRQTLHQLSYQGSPRPKEIEEDKKLLLRASEAGTQMEIPSKETGSGLLLSFKFLVCLLLPETLIIDTMGFKHT